jgi:hypothetical protein
MASAVGSRAWSHSCFAICIESKEFYMVDEMKQREARLCELFKGLALDV